MISPTQVGRTLQEKHCPSRPDYKRKIPMDERKLWSPGIIGFIILGVEFLLPRIETIGFWEFFFVLLITISAAAVFCVGALMKVFRGLKHRQGDAVDTRPGILRGIDAFLGLVGVCVIVFGALAINFSPGILIPRIPFIALFLISSGAGYLMFSKWRNYDFGERAGLGLAWILGAGVSFTFIVSMIFSTEEGRYSNKDAIINDLNNITAQAIQYRIRPKSMEGGNGSYIGFKIPTKMQSNSNATYACLPSANEVTFLAISADNPDNTVIARIDSDGKFIQNAWKYTGVFTEPPD